MIRTFMQAVKYLERYIPTPSKKHPGELGLRRMQKLMDLLGNPQLKYPTIHVGGTSGKGSTATIIASILSTKYKVGLHTSPHLVRVTERIIIYGSCRSGVPPPASSRPCMPGSPFGEVCVGSPSLASPVSKNKDISANDFIDLVNYIRPFVEQVEKSEFCSPSYFEIVAAIAFLYFYQQKVDIAVIEVGMGGKYDATNVIRPEVAVITNVGLDHTEILGDTVEKIAEDKAGIIKSGIQVVTGVKQKSVIRIIDAKCKMQNAKLSLLVPPPRRAYARQFLHRPRSPSATSEVFPWLAFSYHVRKLDSKGSVFDYKGDKRLKNLKLSLLGEYQVENAVLAIKAIEVSRGPLAISARGPLIKVKDIKFGLESAFIPGRLEIIRRNPLVILDGAHNPDKVRAFVTAVKQIFPKKKIIAVIAIKNDKNAKEILTQLLKIGEKVIITKFQLTADIGIIRSYDPELLLRIARDLYIQHRYISRHTKVVKEMVVIPDIKEAVEEAMKSAKNDDLILVTGSLYLVGEIKKFLISND